MNKILQKITVGAFIFIVIPITASAATVLRTGETVSVANDQVVSGDFYATGGTVSHSGLVQGDLYTAAGSFTNNGIVEGDLTIVSGSAQVHASVTDDVRVVGGDVVIAGAVGGDVVVLGGLLKILSTADIKGDVLFFGGELQVLGEVEGSIMGTADKVRIDSHVGQSVDMKTSTLTLGERAEVLGDVRYVSATEIVRSQNAVVVGEIVKNTIPSKEPASYEGYVISFIIVLFSALILQLLFRTQLQTSLPSMTQNMGVAGLIGMAALFIAPVLIVVSLASMLGVLVGLMILFAFILLLLVTCALLSIYIGALVGMYMKNNGSLSVVYTILGAAIIQIMLLVPVLGVIAVAIIYFIVFGSLLRSLFFAIRV